MFKLQMKQKSKSGCSDKSRKELKYHNTPPTNQIAHINPQARAPAQRSDSTSRMIPEIVSPIKISRIEFVMRIPGISSIISPIITLSAWIIGKKWAVIQMPVPIKREQKN